MLEYKYQTITRTEASVKRIEGEIVILSEFYYQTQYMTRKNDEDKDESNENDIIMEQDITFISTDLDID